MVNSEGCDNKAQSKWTLEIACPLRKFQVSAGARRVKDFRLFEARRGEFLKSTEDACANRPEIFAGGALLSATFLGASKKGSWGMGRSPKRLVYS
jgi:hypothetical protein